MALDIEGNMLSRRELELKVLEQERKIADLEAAVSGSTMLATQALQRVRELEKESSFDAAELLARIIKIEKMMGDGK